MKNDEFWSAIDKLVAESEIIIDRPKGTVHPKYPDFVYHHHFTTIINSAPFAEQGILRLS